MNLCEGCEFERHFDNEPDDCRKRALKYGIDPAKICGIYKRKIREKGRKPSMHA